MTLSSFKTLVCSVHGRPPSFWTQEGEDLLLLYMNTIIRDACNTRDFNALQDVLLGTITAGGASLETAFYAAGDADQTAVPLKGITNVYRYELDASDNVILKQEFNYKPKAEADRVRNYAAASNHSSYFSPIYQQGGKLFAQNIALPLNVAVLAYKKPEEITSTNTPASVQFFLDHGSTWLMLAMAELMNYKVNESERKEITKRDKLAAFNSLEHADEAYGDVYSNFTQLM